MMGLNISSSDPTIGRLLELLSSPKAVQQTKQLLEELQAKIEDHRKEAVLARAQRDDVQNTLRIAEGRHIAAEKREEDVAIREAAVEKRELAVAARERKVADAIATIRERVEI
jgi:hypothetical protein